MAADALFKSARGWDSNQFPPEMKDFDPMSKDSATFSDYHDTGKSFVSLNSFVARAIAEYCKGAESKIGLVKIGDGSYAVEHHKSDGTVILFQLNKNGKCQGTVVEASGRYTNLPTFGDKKNPFDCAGICLCLLMRVCEESAKAKSFLEEEAKQYSLSGEFDPTGIYYLCDAVYYGTKKNEIKITMPGGNVDMLSGSSVAVGALNGAVLCGAPELITNAGAKKSGASALTFAQAKRRFAKWADTMEWTEEEEKLIPVFPDDYPVMPETVKLCSRYVGTREDKRPMVNFMWRGITSYGKSTGVAMMAALLHMPLLRVTCNSGMETQDFLSNIVPVSESGVHNVSGELPSFEEIAMDPATAYFTMTGEENEDADCQACLDAYARIVASQSGTTDRLFKQVKSPYVEALEHGYIVEIQEISRIKDSGVLVGLNEYDRPGSIIPLVDGGTVTRHPNAIVVYTDNVGYVSCRPVDPSVLRRMAFIIDSYQMSKEDALDRVVYNTGFSDKAMLNQMYEVWDKIHSHCADKDITEGTVSLTELEMWCQCVIADGYSNLRENCIDCVVAKATSVPEEQAEIISAVVDLTLTSV